MKTIAIFNVLLFFWLMWPVSARGQSMRLHWTSPVQNRFVTFYAEPHGNAPTEMAVLVEPDNLDAQFCSDWERAAQTNHNLIPKSRGSGFEIFDDFRKVAWVPFKTNLLVDFGPGDGGRWLRVSFRNSNEDNPQWEAHHITVQSSPPVIGFTNPTEAVTSRPIIELQGFTSSDWGSPLKYKVFDQSGIVTARGEGLVNDRYFDRNLWDFTTNYFTCYDIKLSPGTNTIKLQGKDRAGFSFSTNLVYVFTTEGDHTPPVISLEWPRPGESLSGRSFDARGRLDDFTAQITGQISANGETNVIPGLLERDGYFWVERLPLALGKNYLTLTATDAAGNSSSTSLAVIGVEGELTMDPVLPADRLWDPFIDATGKISPPGQRVWINGVQAKVNPDGTWSATHVPVRSSLSGGTAIFDLTAHSPEEITNPIAGPPELLSAQVNLGTNVMTLNASKPACGVFQIHINNTEQAGFVLLVSTNLVDWEPLLTNSNPKAAFDFTDTNANNYPCRFFRIVPLR